MEAIQTIIKSRAAMILEAQFFGTLALKLKIVEENKECDSCGTDGENLFYNESYIKKQTKRELMGVLAHEVMHCVGNHSGRRQNRDPKLWNVACDYAINPIVIKSGFILPEGVLIDSKYENQTPEHIYALLQTENPGHEPCTWGHVLDRPANSKQSAAELEASWQVAVTAAVQQAKDAGKLPGHLEQFVKDIVKPRVDWRSELWPFCTAIARDDYSYKKYNRAYIAEDLFLPSLMSESCGELALIIDSSLSCKKYWDMFSNEFRAIHAELKPDKLHILTVDTKVQNHIVVEANDEWPNIAIKGGGGTKFKPAFDFINKELPDVEAAVYLTDLESYDFGDQPNYPTLWVSTTGDEAPWGKTTQIMLEES
ncbi:MAG: DUF2201 family putative metallopeptidase [Vibrio toranzoniae]|uniref:vWA domain-containing protein n=1 Tax=Vibrio toranzoniae TaxID=1194427 RepID=UPI003C3B25AF